MHSTSTSAYRTVESDLYVFPKIQKTDKQFDAITMYVYNTKQDAEEL